jgi:hypothetical protein
MDKDCLLAAAGRFGMEADPGRRLQVRQQRVEPDIEGGIREASPEES